MSHLRLATRRSPLALAQATSVSQRLLAHGITSELVLIDTTGDVNAEVPLREVAGLGVFALEVQRAVLDARADVAVHSAKDLPARSPEGLHIASTPERANPSDVMVGRALSGLGPGATVATGSPRRRALLLERRPDLNIVELRGNMGTRLGAVGTRGIDAVVAAAAALERLGWQNRVSEYLEPSWFVPQVGQGTLALEIRDGDDETSDAVSTINDALVMRSLIAERAFLLELGAGCAIPAAAFATVESEQIELAGVMAASDGSRVVRSQSSGTSPAELGRALAVTLRDELGGGELVGWNE